MTVFPELDVGMISIDLLPSMCWPEEVTADLTESLEQFERYD